MCVCVYIFVVDVNAFFVPSQCCVKDAGVIGLEGPSPRFSLLVCMRVYVMDDKR